MPSLRPLLLVALGAVLTSTGCAPPIPDGGFDAPDPASRIYAAVRVAADFERTGIRPDRTILEDLVVMLASSDPATRFIASQTLQEIAGTDLGYHPSAPLPERMLAADRWRAWVEALPASSGARAS
jgi:hypothetical protein